jgi:hypothetical protein
MRTSSASNVGADKDGKKRQRAAIDGYAKAAGYVVVDWYYDVAVKGTDIVTARQASLLSENASRETAYVPSPLGSANQ